MIRFMADAAESNKDNGITISPGLPLLLFTLTTHSMTANALSHLDTTLTPATRLEHRQPRTDSEQALTDSAQADAQSEWQSHITGEHRWYSWAAVWQVHHQQRLDSDESHTERQLSELSWNPVLSDQLSLRIGKFSQDIERSSVFQPLGFFQTPAAPFDSFASIEGLWMASLTWWVNDWIITPMIARNAPTEFPATAAQRSPHQHRSPHQWGLVLERDFDSLSATLLAQQFQGQKAGLGFGYSWVSGTHWQFSGSGFIRQSSQYLSGYNQTSTALNHEIEHALSTAPALPENVLTASPSPYRQQDSGYFPRLSQGIQWSGLEQTLTVELHYDRRKLTRREQTALYQNTDRSTAESTDLSTADQELAAVISDLGDAIRLLSEDRHQQRYLYGSYRWEDTEHQWNASVLLGADHSHWSQIRYTRFINWSVSIWAEVDHFSGDDSTEFGRVPWQSIYRLGGQWVF